MKTITSAMANPEHPGPFVREELIEAYGLTVTAAAKVLGVSRPNLSNLLHGHVAMSGDMAIRFEKAFGVPMVALLKMQAAYDIAQAQTRAARIKVKRYQGTLTPEQSAALEQVMR
jgi:addiction module HigA family antidote